jgi:hypothetical protein
MYSLLRLLLILRLLRGDCLGRVFGMILCAVVFWVLIYSVVH